MDDVFYTIIFILTSLMSLSTGQPYEYKLTKNYLVKQTTRVQISITSTTVIDTLCAVDTAKVGVTYDAFSELETKPSCCVQTPGTTIELDFYVDASNTITLPTTGPSQTLTLADCGFLDVDAAKRKYRMSVRTFADRTTDSLTDQLFMFPLDIKAAKKGKIKDIFTLIAPATYNIVDLTDVSYNMYLEFLTTNYEPKTGAWSLGDDACLQATMKVDSSNEGFQGIRVHSCHFTETEDTTGSTLYIGTNGCTSDRLEPYISADTGFQKYSYSVLGTKATFTTRFPCFELFTFGYASSLSITCDVELCIDPNDPLTLGQCGGPNCDPAETRRKREAHGNTTAVSAKITLNKPSSPTRIVRPCSESPVFKATIGILLSIIIVLAFCIAACLVSVSKKRREMTSHWKRKSDD